MVAELVGRSHAAPLFHFPDRMTLVAAVAAEGFRQLVVTLGSSAGRKRTGAQRLRDTALRYAQWAGETPALFATMYDPELAPALELLAMAPDEDDATRRIAERFGGAAAATRRRVQALRELLDAKQEALMLFVNAARDGIVDGSLRADMSPVQIAHAVASMADGLAWQRVTEPQGSVQLLDRHASVTLRLLLQGISAQA